VGDRHRLLRREVRLHKSREASIRCRRNRHPVSAARPVCVSGSTRVVHVAFHHVAPVVIVERPTRRCRCRRSVVVTWFARAAYACSHFAPCGQMGADSCSSRVALRALRRGVPPNPAGFSREYGRNPFPRHMHRRTTGSGHLRDVPLGFIARKSAQNSTLSSSKGQIVIPAELRQQDGIEAGQEFDIRRPESGERLLLRP